MDGVMILYWNSRSMIARLHKSLRNLNKTSKMSKLFTLLCNSIHILYQSAAFCNKLP